VVTSRIELTEGVVQGETQVQERPAAHGLSVLCGWVEECGSPVAQRSIVNDRALVVEDEGAVEAVGVGRECSEDDQRDG
jgi:hypothetical protein